MKGMIFGLVLLLTSVSTFAEVYKIGVEPLPPFIIDAKSGLSIELLKEVEKLSPGDTFEIVVAPYNRLKEGLKAGTYDMMAHTPYALEVKEFYEYAEDVAWKTHVTMDLIALNKETLANPSAIKKIGTPRGNKEFAAEFTGIPVSNFYDNGSTESLLLLLKEGRIDAFWFPRATVLAEAKKVGLNPFYKAVPTEGLDIAFSTSKSPKGKELRNKFESALKKIKWQEIYKSSLEAEKMPSEGKY